MQKILINFFSLTILVLIVASCSQNRRSKNLDSWIGSYSYEEEPVKAIAGYSMTMRWTLSINKINDSCQGVVEVNGQQTYIKLLADISGDTNFIELKYNRLIEGSSESLKKGDTLFYLLKKNNEIQTKWHTLEPRLTDNPPSECNCFDITKNNGH